MYKYLLLPLLLFTFSSSKAQVNLSSGLVAYYPFQGNANDLSGNANNPIFNNATLTTDHYGNPNSAYYFDGQSSYMQIPHSASLSPTGPMTITAYVKPMGFYYGPCHGNAVVDKGQDGTNSNYGIRFDDRLFTNGANCSNTSIDSVHQNFYGIRGSAASPALVPYSPYITKGNWYCMIAVQTVDSLKFYINGVFVSSTFNPIASLSTNTSDLFFGKKNSAQFPYWFNGVIDEVRIYNRALNNLEIDSLCNLSYSAVVSTTTVNKYAAVLSRSTCDNSYVVDTATGFNVGDTVLMVQMKGATVDSSNTSAFGNVLSYNGAGNYEFNTIKSVTGNIITLKYRMKRNYDIPNGKVQFVRVANYQNYTANQVLTALPWNGSKGGVLMMNVAGTLTLNSNIDVTGKGFNGGQILLSTQYSCNQTSYYYPSTNNNGAQKGEGISTVSAAKMYGRGNLANGGGGGNDHNSSGGGGGNGGIGGLGGNQFQLGACAVTPNIGGIGGDSLSYSNATNKIYLGGGGGAGHGNNLGEKPGAPGGGIVFIIANNVISNGNSIIANGANAFECPAPAPGCQDDGVGGGGGGGLIIASIANYTNPIVMNAKGGKGANAFVNLATNTTPMAPGGGGGGGAIWYTQASIPANTTNNVLGGLNGVEPQFSNTNYGAQPGTPGRLITGFPYTFPTIIDTFKPYVINIAFSDSNVSCYTRKMVVTLPASGVTAYAWSAGPGGTSAVRNPTFTFPDYGTYAVRLIVIDSNGCKDSLTRNVVIPYNHFANAGNDTITCRGLPVMLHATGGITYSWSPSGTLSNPGSATPIATALSSTSYTVTETNSQGCIDKDSVMLVVVAGAQVVARPHDTIVCAGKTVQFSATGVNTYQWSPTTNLDNPGIANPIVTYTGGSISYIVTGKDVNGCISFDTVNITERPRPTIIATADGLGVSCYSRSIQLHAVGAVAYTWHPGVSLNDSTLPSPLATPIATTLYTVSGIDAAGCTGTDTITIVSYGDKVVFIPNVFTPNGDHVNDDIRPVIYCNFKLDKWEIFNRWGQSVYSSNDLNKGWDGRFNDVPEPVGVYVYYIKGKNDNGESVVYKGNITLLR